MMMLITQSHDLTEGITILILRVSTVGSVMWPTACIGGTRGLCLAYLAYKVLQLLDAHKFLINDLLCVLVDSIIGIEFFLQLNNSLITFIQSWS